LPELSAIRSEHPAVFPVKLPEEYIKAMTKENDYVIEPFGGSGTTLIACEKTNRKCRIMELDPKYCDVIRRRYTQWAKENGKPLTSGCLD
jgi:DNA modification methylase